MTQYICFEGGEGTYKTTTVAAMARELRHRGYTVLETKEPGTIHLPLTLELRKIMLSNEYDDQLTVPSRELISQAIRSIHLEKLILPAVQEESFDFILQDRGIMSGSIYAAVCGNSKRHVDTINAFVTSCMMQRQRTIYDHIFVFHNTNGLQLAISGKDEFGGGDAMESRGDAFHEEVNRRYYLACQNPEEWSYFTNHITSVEVDGMTTNQIVYECLKTLGLVICPDAHYIT